MTWKTWICVSLCVVALCAGRSVPAEEVREGWRVDFDDGSLNGASDPVFSDRREGPPQSDRLIYRLQQGVVTLGGQFDKADDYAELTWPALGSASLESTPVLEIRFKASDPACYLFVQPTYLSVGGTRHQLDLYCGIEPGQEGQWQTATWRLAGDGSPFNNWFPRALLELSIRVHSDRPAHAEIDWVRLREFNATEQQRENEWLSLVKAGPPAEPAILREFFPFGVYDDAPDIQEHSITHRHSFDVMARHHLNYKQAGHLGAERDDQGAVVRVTAGPTLPAAEETGMRVSIRVRPAVERFATGGAEAARAWAKSSVDVIGDNPVVIGYDVGDERPVTDLWQVAGAVGVLNQLDLTRPSMMVFFDDTAIRAHNPYVCLHLSDIYPLQDNSTLGPDYLYEWCRKVAKETGNKRHWAVLQTYGTARGRRHTSAILPSDAELRLMTYGSIAGGARGIIFYSFNFDRFDMLVDQWANPINGLLPEISRLGEHLIPIGQRLLDAEVDVDAIVQNSNEEHVIVGVLNAPARGVYYLVVVNKDTQGSQVAALTLPSSWQNQEVLDLTTLKEISSQPRVSLAPGDGNIYMVGSAEQCREDAYAIEGNQIKEKLRVLQPDLSTARSWGVNVTQVTQWRDAAEALIAQKGQLDAAQDYVSRATALLESLLAQCQPYASIRAQLDQIGRRMGEVEPAMYEDNPDADIARDMTPFRGPYWQLHARWAKTYDLTLHGQKADLTSHVDTIALDADQLLAKVHQTLNGRPMYPR